MEAILEGAYPTEVTTAAADRPEQICVFICASGEGPTVGSDDFRRQQVIDGHSVLPHQVAEPPAAREASNAGGGNHAPGGPQFVYLGFAVEFAPVNPALGADRAASGVHVDPFH